jgi:hypothetical protein
MNLVDLPTKKLPTLEDLRDDLNDLYYNKYNDLNGAAFFGVLEIFKWDCINNLPQKDEI